MTQEHDADTVMAAIKAIPTREERLGGQTFKYVKLCEVLDTLSAMPAREVTGWQPIETAPKDGTSVLLYMPHRICEGWFAKGEWTEDTPISPAEYSGEVWVCCDDAFQVEVELWPGVEHHGVITHWMPLPPAPEGV